MFDLMWRQPCMQNEIKFKAPGIELSPGRKRKTLLSRVLALASKQTS